VATVFRSTVIDAPVETVWGILRDFNGHDRWHPAVEESHIEGVRAGDQVGAVRNFKLASGAQLREQLIKLSDRDRSLTYCILDAPLPLIGYVATISLKRVTDGERTFWNWKSTFEAPPGLETALERLVAQDIYEAGFAAVSGLLAKTSPARSASGEAVRVTIRSAVRTTARQIRCHAVRIDSYGGADVLDWREVQVPSPSAGEVRLRQTAVGVNFIDINVRAGRYPQFPPPLTPGVEAVGEVVDVGEGVTGIAPGDRVGYVCLPPGAYAQYRNVPADRLVRIPHDISDETAAAVLLKGMTAEYLLHRAHRVGRGDMVLVHSAAGATGMLLCQWAKHLGATVIGTVSSEDKARVARDNGCDHSILYTHEDFAARVKELTGGKGVDVAYDAVGRETLLRSFEALALRGHLVSYGQSSGAPEPLDIGMLTAKSAKISRPAVFHYIADPAELRDSAGAVFEHIARGVLRPITRIRPLSEAAQVHRELESRSTIGAAVLAPG
jgi:NADPH:quinone reductase-like Zn-dependent oxidoreductase